MRKKALYFVASLVGPAGLALAATPVTYTATAAPGANPDGTDQTSASLDVWQETLVANAGGSGGYFGATWDPNAWVIYSYPDAGAGTADENHTFTGGAISVGQTFSISFANSAVLAGQQVGFSLLGGSSPISFTFTGGDTSGHYRYSDAGTSGGDTGMSFAYQTPFTVALTFTSATTYSATAGTGSWTGTYSGGPTSIDVFNHAAGNGSDVGFNTLKISSVPEPMSLGAMALVGAGALLRRRR